MAEGNTPRQKMTAFGIEPENDVFKLPGVMSRKKQLIPALMSAAQTMETDY